MYSKNSDHSFSLLQLSFDIELQTSHAFLLFNYTFICTHFKYLVACHLKFIDLVMCVRARVRLGLYMLERIWVSPATLWDSDIKLSSLA